MRLEDILRKLQVPEWLDRPEQDPEPDPSLFQPDAKPPAAPGIPSGAGAGINKSALDDLMGGQQVQMPPEKGIMSPELTPAQRKLRHLGRMSALTKEEETKTPDTIKTLMG